MPKLTQRLLVSTRKGLFVLAQADDRWQIERVAFLGDNVTFALADRRDGSWYAALNLGHFGVKLRRSVDQGITWDELAVPTYAEGQTVATGDGKPAKPANLSLLWSLETGGTDQPGRLWAGTIPGGLFCSDDSGKSWSLVEALWNRPERANWFGGGYDQPGIHSICVDPRDSNCIRVAVSCAGVWQTADGGDSWRQSAHGMFAAFMPPERRDDPEIQDPHRMVQCLDAPDHFWVQHHNGVFRSTDAANSWTEVANVPPSVFGFGVAVHPHDANGAWFVPAVKDECRVPVEGRLVVARTRDGGQSFAKLSAGLPQSKAYDLIYRHGMAIDESGDRLAIGSTSGGLWTTNDGGDHWLALDERLPPIYAMTFA
ncbi:MAG: exo-alpha-sialidase [Dokdonella sp.]